MTKKDLFSVIGGNDVLIRTKKPSREKQIENLKNQVYNINENLKRENKELCTYEIVDNVITLSNGQYFHLPKAPRIGKFVEKSKHVLIGGMYTEKKNIKNIEENNNFISFETDNFNFIVFTKYDQHTNNVLTAIHSQYLRLLKDLVYSLDGHQTEQEILKENNQISLYVKEHGILNSDLNLDIVVTAQQTAINNLKSHFDLWYE